MMMRAASRIDSNDCSNRHKHAKRTQYLERIQLAQLSFRITASRIASPRIASITTRLLVPLESATPHNSIHVHTNQNTFSNNRKLTYSWTFQSQHGCTLGCSWVQLESTKLIKFKFEKQSRCPHPFPDDQVHLPLSMCCC